MMMKKKYDSPRAEMFRVEASQMMNTSPLEFDGRGGGGITPQDKDAEGDAMSRGGGGWDD